ncbi:MAG: SPFH domain-containing protein [Chloroflexi bacterium]|nr:SPFH domain-containing protein [Chloroflexota bacterium]
MPRIIDVISHPNVMEDELVWREPQQGNGDFRFGSRVIVQESQVAIFVRQGQVLDALGPGAHTISTGNLPLLSEALDFLIASGKNIFTADVYFVNLRDLPQVPWGTNPPIYMETPGRGAGFMLLRNRGVIDIAIDDPIRFLKQYGIGRPSLRLADIRDRLQTIVLGEIAELISREKITTVQDANRLISSLESALLASLSTEFQALGLRLKSFQAGTFDVKELTQEDIIKYGGDARTFAEMRRLDIAEAAAQNPGLGGAAAGAGMGLGLGQALGAAMNPEQAALQQQLQQQQLMMQQMMMQMMANQANQQQQARQAQPQQPPANPQTKEEIEALIANLDMRLANGEISEATYNRLVERWEKRLKELGG